MMLLHVLLSFILNLFFQNPNFETSASSVTYSMVHKLHSWQGVSKDLKVATKWNEQKNEIEQISIVVNVATFNSGLSSRDCFVQPLDSGGELHQIHQNSDHVLRDNTQYRREQRWLWIK